MTNKFVSVLDKICHIGKDIFKVAVPVIEAAEPVLDIAIPIFVPSLAPLWSMAESFVKTYESAASAAGATKAGPQKMALVVAALLPQAITDAQKLGILPPTSAQMQVFVQGVVDQLKAFGALA